jgi:hypothetical protein
MPVTRAFLGCFLAFLWALVSLGEPTSVRADEAEPSADQCIAFHVNAQAMRVEGKFSLAGSLLKQCLHPACSSLLRNDCAELLAEVEAETPTVVLAARASGVDLLDVRVSEASVLLHSTLDGRPIALDAGHHELLFEAQGMVPRTQAIVVRAGEKNRLVSVELEPLAPPKPLLSVAAPEPRKDTVPAPKPFLARISRWEWAWFGTSVAAGAASLGVGLAARLDFERAKDECFHHCSHARLSSIRQKAIVSDSLLALSAVGLLYVTLHVTLRERHARSTALLLGPGSAAARLSF